MTNPDEIRAAFEEWARAHDDGGDLDLTPDEEDGGYLCGTTDHVWCAYLAGAQRFGVTAAERAVLDAAETWADEEVHYEDVSEALMRAVKALRAEREPDHLAEALACLQEVGGPDVKRAVDHLRAAMGARDGK